MEVRRLYEAMFLADAGLASNWERLEETINRIMQRAGAEVLYCKKWDERRLAYEIETVKRGLYVLVFFKADPAKIEGIQRDVQLSEDLTRVLVLRQDRLAEEKVRELARGEGVVPVRPVIEPGQERRRYEGGYGDRRRDRSSRFNRDETAPTEDAAEGSVETAGT